MIRLLLDQGVPRSTAPLLRERGVEVRHVADVGLARATDTAILHAAREQGELVVTLDADFHSLLAVAGASSPSVLRIRLEGLRGAEMAELIQRVLEQTGDQLSKGALVTVNKRSIRVHRLPVLRRAVKSTNGSTD